MDEYHTASSSSPSPSMRSGGAASASLVGRGAHRIFGGKRVQASAFDPHSAHSPAPVFDEDEPHRAVPQSPLHASTSQVFGLSAPRSRHRLEEADKLRNESLEHRSRLASMEGPGDGAGKSSSRFDPVARMHPSPTRDGAPLHHGSVPRDERIDTFPRFSSNTALLPGAAAALALNRQQAPVVKSVLKLKTGDGRRSPARGAASPRRSATSPVPMQQRSPRASSQIESEGQALASMAAIFRAPASSQGEVRDSQHDARTTTGGAATAARAMQRLNPHGYTVADVDRLRDELHAAVKEGGRLRSENDALTSQLQEMHRKNAELLRRFEHSQNSLATAVETIKVQEKEIAHLRQSLSGEVYDNASLKEHFKSLIDVAKCELGTLREQVALQERAAHYVGPARGNGDVHGVRGLLHPFDTPESGSWSTGGAGDFDRPPVSGRY